ncbi:O-methyltransferase [Actinokineospora iranica]|uniref:Caffeoyl-CoA O-methyltransferase n=1 Tax=Actinokineospora iranica TaxID=1271860 RepID=A0A1G6S8R2_9PSEU|nr:O-methyltransferase [Actinokineospora iranica]SDD12545.1 caffeoyl-CoA O-methyltransferase [Actinokineospora iranica]
MTGPSKGRFVDAFKNIVMTQPIYDYLLRQAPPPSPAQARLIQATADLGDAAEMQIPHEQGVFLTMLAELIGARRIVEVGTFTGYSALCLALGLVPGGMVLTCDISDTWEPLARSAWQEAGVADRIDFRLGPAEETLRRLPEDPVLDLVFIDADKTGYLDYWELLVPRVRPGGVLLADNVLYYGEAAQEDAQGNAKAIRQFNDRVRADDRVKSVLLPIADGLTIAMRTAET